MTRYPFTVFVALCCGAPAYAEWTLDGEASELAFVSTKAVDIAEVHRFGDLAGRISDKGKAIVSIALASVDTGIPLRDERMQSMLFEVDDYPEARVRTKIDMDAIAGIDAGGTIRMDAEFDLDLHGAEVPMSGSVIITKLSETVLTVTSTKPLVLDASGVGLAGGIEALRKVANLPSIGKSVPVSFILTFIDES